MRGLGKERDEQEMSIGTTIEWPRFPGYTAATWNPTRGCSRVSEGCRNCYAERIAGRFSAEGGDQRLPFSEFAIMTPSGPRWTGRVELVEHKLLEPLKRRQPTCYFVNSMSDLFHENLRDETIDRVFAVMAVCPQHLFIGLTKRAERMSGYLRQPAFAGRRVIVNDQIARWMQSMDDFPRGRSFPRFCGQWPLANVILGVSVEDQAAADQRIPHLLATPAACRVISYEPALGPLDLSRYLTEKGVDSPPWVAPPWADWVIAGGESGPRARPSHPDWFRGLRKQCADAGVPFFLKQITHNGREIPFDEWPEDLRVMEFPDVG